MDERRFTHGACARLALAPKELGADEDGAHSEEPERVGGRPVTRWVEAEAAGERPGATRATVPFASLTNARAIRA